ncbi:hypothetical protein EDD11_005506 [Mortierella claussenii]|nr:hypothetical protein EDD11_005506 [Mortierella claussenii]
MLASDHPPPRNKILVVGRRGVGKLTLVQSILGSRFVPTTSVSKSRPSSPLILPAIPVPTLEETLVDGHGVLSQGISTFAPPNLSQASQHALEDMDIASTAPPITAPSSTPSSAATGGGGASDFSSCHSSQPSQSQSQSQSQSEDSQQQQQQFNPGASLESIGGGSQATRPKVDHSGVTIPWTIDTKYYSVKVDFWIDETEARRRVELERMIEAGELDEMGAVVEAVIFCYSKNEPSTFHDIKPWLAYVERHEPSITLCVATGAPSTQQEQEAGQMQQDHTAEDEEVVDDYDEWCLANGFEFIDLQDEPRDLTQDEHVGLDRIMEALAAHMWDGLKRKSSKKRDQHERSMMMSFRDDDMDMTYDSSYRAGGISRRSLLGLDVADMSLQDGGMQGMDCDDDDEDDSEDEDEGGDKAFSRALQELNMYNRSASPPTGRPLLGVTTGQGVVGSALSQGTMRASIFDQAGGMDSDKTQDHSGFDDDFDLKDDEIRELERDDVWSSSQDDSGSIAAIATLSGRSNDIERALEKQFKKFLGQPVDDGSMNASSEYGGNKESSSGELDSSLEKEFSSFELNEDGEFEFGDFVVSEGPGGQELEDLDIHFGVQGVSTPSQESIKSMHRALFANIDDDDGMAQTLATLQGLRGTSYLHSNHDPKRPF